MKPKIEHDVEARVPVDPLVRRFRAAYADPPYLGCGAKLYGELHAQAAECDSLDFHRELIERLSSDFDAWALSLHSPSLRDLLPLCPDDVRVAAWVKPFCSYKPGVNPAYAWEPVIFRGGRKRPRGDDKIRDFISEPVRLGKARVPGEKPRAFCFWIFDLLGLQPDDDLHDLFPGSGAVSEAWEAWKLKDAPEQFCFGV